MKRTNALVSVAVTLMSDPEAQFWGYQLSKACGLRSGVLYPILQRLLDEKWLADGWEKIDPGSAGRPPRRYYTLTATGIDELGALAASAPVQAPSRHRVRFA